MTNKVENLKLSHRESPITFNGQMVRSILSGNKTQTRQVVKNASIYDQLTSHECFDQPDIAYLYRECPYGNPGDFLWVKETWDGPYANDEESRKIEADSDAINFDDFNTRDRCIYEADGSKPDFLRPDFIAKHWIPGIHMPRWASRILLQITDIRIERLQSISENDIIKEGIKEDETDKPEKFIDLWERTGGIWIENPWVWVITFSRVDNQPILRALMREATKLKLITC